VKLFEPTIDEKSLENILNVLKNGDLGFGSNVPKFEEEFSSYSGKQYNVATNSASAAAFMIFYYLKEAFGTCDIYTTTLGFVSPVWAAKHLGHNVNFVDITKDLQFDCSDYFLKRGNSNSVNQAVVMPVLYGGVDTIKDWKVFGDEVVVVDSAHSVTPTIKADYCFFSFHPLKPVCSSDGGMISTDIENAAEYFRTFRNFGRTREGSTYSLSQPGFKFYMNNLNASIALESIKKYPEQREKRKENYEYIRDRVSEALVPHTSNSSYYIGSALRDDAEEMMKKLETSRLYPLLHKSHSVGSKGILISAERIHPKIMNFPIHHNLTKEQIEFIISIL
jgi:perosamine synthetase